MTASVLCLHCGTFFAPRNRQQNYCRQPACQRARKTAWERQRRKTDSDYRHNRRLSQEKWLHNNPGYWKTYRQTHPKQAERNRMLQKLRNRKSVVNAVQSFIAKVDARKPPPLPLIGPFWLIADIAKVDLVKIYFHAELTSWP
ncbi:MAG: hypothetical protein ACLFNW_09110 [Desulfobacterales bacterium]